MNTGYDYEQADEEIKELVCSICFLLIRDAIELGCGHSLCSGCLEKWDKKVSESEALRFECPQCKEPINKKKVKKNHTLNRIITTSIKIKCPNCEEGCEWVDVISNVNDHIEIYCKHNPMQCPDGCNVIFCTKDIEQHKSECIFRPVKCQHCQNDQRYCELEKHYTECEDMEVKCSNHGCNEILKRAELMRHFDICPFELVACHFHDFGCAYMVARSSLDAHCKSNMEIHLALVTAEMRALKEVSKKQVFRLQEELDSTKQMVCDLRSELADYQQTNEIEKHFRKEVNQLVSEMNSSLESLEKERDIVASTIKGHIAAFDKSYALLEGKLDELNSGLKLIVEESVSRFSPKMQSFKERNLEKMLTDCVRYTLGREFCGQLTPELMEKFKLPVYMEERKVLMGKLHMELASIQALLEEFTFPQRFQSLLRNMLPNTKTAYGHHKFLIKLKMTEYFQDEWTIVVLKKQNVFSEFNAERQNNLLVNKTVKTIAVFLGEDLFTNDVPSVSVCSPRGKYKLRLPILPKDEFRFRINFTTLVASNYLTDGFFLIRITEVPRLVLDSSFFTR